MDQQQHIDALLERYLGLLDEYTQLRKSLSQIQSNVYQNIARANFAGERGMRYGQDHYDERMQAIRLLPSSMLPLKSQRRKRKPPLRETMGNRRTRPKRTAPKSPLKRSPRRTGIHCTGTAYSHPCHFAQPRRNLFRR